MSYVVRIYVLAVFFIPGSLGSVLGQEFDCSVNATTTTTTMSLQSSRVLSRGKRYVAFPSGSAFVATLTLLKAIQVREPSNWNLDLEFDMIWPIPNEEKLYRRRPHKRVKSFHRTRRHRRDLYTNIELALTSQGLPGKKCLLRAICEAKTYLNLPGVSFVDDILRIILSHDDPVHKLDPYDIAYLGKTDCALEYTCPISILELLLAYHSHL